MSQAAVARGPIQLLLSSAGSQYIVLGLGACAAFPEQAKELMNPVLHEIRKAGFLAKDGETSKNKDLSSPIIIRTSSGLDATSLHGAATNLAYAVIAAGACWGVYVVGSIVLPETFNQLMPVTKEAFEQASQVIGKGIVSVKEVVEKRIQELVEKTKELTAQQRDTHNTARGIQDELGNAKTDLGFLQATLNRCENSLVSLQGIQNYTSRGVNLLIRGVSSVLPGQSGDSEFRDEVDRYVEDGKSLDAQSGKDGSPPSEVITAKKTTMTPVKQSDLPPSLRFPTGPGSAATPMADGGPTVDGNLIPRDTKIQALLGHA